MQAAYYLWHQSKQDLRPELGVESLRSGKRYDSDAGVKVMTEGTKCGYATAQNVCKLTGISRGMPNSKEHRTS